MFFILIAKYNVVKIEDSRLKFYRFSVKLNIKIELNGCIRALKKATYQAKTTKGIIHHSDRGIQYCSNQYTDILKRKKMEISMTEENHCYENAMAERLNGILKDEFFLDQTFINVNHAKRATKNAIKLYNNQKITSIFRL